MHFLCSCGFFYFTYEMHTVVNMQYSLSAIPGSTKDHAITTYARRFGYAESRLSKQSDNLTLIAAQEQQQQQLSNMSNPKKSMPDLEQRDVT